ncbi:hypothetical protein FJT64_023583 [Amphibalanus amphitrite]|uniref:F-box/LRR-repeat protein 20 n=1 Tax=Amphibalanus amphitrite TaxID=1232801 RepID=A0A6A4WBJ0_AMPAM|nr:hypothetical protein FJT64_023583 [Amphibalanus amphitrite]
MSLELLTECPKLYSLTLSGGVTDAVSLEPITRCPKLHTLSLSGGVTDAMSLELLTSCPELRHLTLSGVVTDAVSLELLTRCPGLKRLTLSGGVTDAVLDSLSGCPGLEDLTLGDRQRPAETAFTAAAVSSGPELDLPDNIIADLSSGKLLLYQLTRAVRTGNISAKEACKKIGPLNHVRCPVQSCFWCGVVRMESEESRKAEDLRMKEPALWMKI